MNGNENFRPEELRARDALRALAPPVAEAAFRERLKREFVAGDVVSRIDWPPAGAASRFGIRRYAGVLALAATLALALITFNRSPGPSAFGGSGQGFVSVDGRQMATSDLTAIGELLHGGAKVTLGDGAILDLAYAGNMSWRLFPGTTVTLPDAPGRWFGRAVSAHVEIGEVSVRTGDRFHGALLALSTDEGRALVTGTLVSVVRDAAVTCVCVHEGTVQMESAAGLDLGDIPVGKRRVLFRDGSEPVLLDIAAPHRDHLIEFDADLQRNF